MTDVVKPKNGWPWLERCTAAVLVLVILVMGWMVLAENLPDWLRLESVEAEVLAVLMLLFLALGLVSGLALWHTRS